MTPQEMAARIDELERQNFAMVECVEMHLKARRQQRDEAARQGDDEQACILSHRVSELAQLHQWLCTYGRSNKART